MKKTEWFQKAGFGMIVHWGLYSIPAGVWDGKRCPHTAEWLMKNLTVPLKDYRELAKRFDPKSFDADQYVRLAKKWGMKYVVVTAKHHDGFALYDTKYSDYSVMTTPYGKDVIRQFADACEREGLIFCVYYSQMQDWEHPHGNGNTWDFDPKDQNFEIYYRQKVIPQVRELLTNYGKIGLVWFDTPYDMPIELCRELAEVVRELQPDCLINGRIGYHLGDYKQMADNSIPQRVYPNAWEVPMTLNLTWGYSSFDDQWIKPEKVISNLVTVRGKGGNLLLNIGPDADGRIPEESIAIMDRVGEWIEKNGESVYGTSPMPDFPYVTKWGHLSYNAEQKRMYMHVQEYPTLTPRVSLLGLKTRVKRCTLLATGEELSFTQTYEQARDEERFAVWIPVQCPDAIDTVIAVDLEDDIDVQVLEVVE